MKKLLVIVALGTITASNAQWVSEKVDNGLDEPYKICYNENAENELLKMQNGNKNSSNEIMLYIENIDICKETSISTDLSLLVNDKWIRYHFICFSKVNRAMIVSNILLYDEFLLNFKLSKSIKFRFNFINCDSKIYEFNMLGSTAAINFMNK
jgi:hypothetical protein